MPLQKQSLPINFGQGVDTKTDPFQIPFGRFLELSNTIFNKGGLLQKRNGYPMLTPLPDATSSYLTTFNGNLTALGNSLKAYSSGSKTWTNKGAFQPIELETLSLIRNSTSQTQGDSAVSSNGLVCTVYTDTPPSGTVYYYAVADQLTGQNIVAPTAYTASGSSRVFVLGRYFVIVYTSGTNLKYISINITVPTIVTAPATISAAYTPASTVAFDGVVANNNLYLAWNGNDGGGAIRMTYIDSTLIQHNTVIFAGKACTMMSVTADMTSNTPIIWATFYNPTGTLIHTLAVDHILSIYVNPVQLANSDTALNITSAAQNGVNQTFWEVSNAYAYDSSIKTNFIRTRTCNNAGTAGTASIVLRSVGLGSKAFLQQGVIYFLAAYSSQNQPSYFLSNSTGALLAKLAYGNGGGYLTLGLPNVTVSGTVCSMAYLIKDLITPVNKNTNVPSGSQISGIYSQTGINLASFAFDSTSLVSAEIGNDLHLSGGFLWMYDGYLPVEHQFHLWPEFDLNADGTYHGLSTSTTGGNLADQKYFYVATYEWTDNQGNIFRSAPSVPVSITTAGGGTSTNTIKIPTLRLTYKTANPVRIIAYRWSTAQQTYYQVASAITLNSTTTDSVTITDTFSDATILGNQILYTTGGVVENIAAPACKALTLFRSRLFLIPAEDENLLWYSKQVIESTPVEMTDLFTLFVSPTVGAQGSTGKLKAQAAMDDKLILFKKDAIYYLTGNGPDNTGANNDFSEPIFVTSTVGCENQRSIVSMPNGLMFQSDKGIWILKRDLSTQYIGVDVEGFSTGTVQSATAIPGTNEVRFTFDTGITLMYDYYFNQWSVFENIPAISSTLYQGLHTYINDLGQVFQEQPGTYLDGSNPTLIRFKTGWFNLAGLQGFQRAYFFYLLATYLSPHRLKIEIAYDYRPSPSQVVYIQPDNFSGVYGDDSLYGSGANYGGSTQLEQWRIDFDQQKCQAFQITVTEIFDSTKGVSAGAGFTLSGLNLIVGMKGNYPRLNAARTTG